MAIDPSAKKEDQKEVGDPQAIVCKLFDPNSIDYELRANDEFSGDQYYLFVWYGWRTPVEFMYTIYELANTPLPFPGANGLKLKNVPGFAIAIETNQAQALNISLLDTLAEGERLLGTAQVYPRNMYGHQAGDLRQEEYRNESYWDYIPRVEIVNTFDKIERIGGPKRRGYFQRRYFHFLPSDPNQDILLKQYVYFEGKQTHGSGVPLEGKLDGPDADQIGDQYFFEYAARKQMPFGDGDREYQWGGEGDEPLIKGLG